MVDPKAIGIDISRFVQSSPNGQILGSSLAVLVKRVYPDFRAETFGCKNLRDFIRRYARDVFETARRGTDVVYSAAVLPAVSPEATRSQELRVISATPTRSWQPAISTPVWKTFTSPNAFYRAFANRESGEFRVLRWNEEAPGEPWVQVQPCSATAHLQIAKDFVENLSDEAVKAELAKVLGLDSWWTHFFVATRRFGVEPLWSAFRRRRLHLEFLEQLKSLGVPLPLTSETTHARAVEAAPAKSTDAPPSDVADNPALRRIASAVIRRLPASELREVWLPLGYVLDEIGEK